MESPGITAEDIDESISWLLQKNEIIEIERDVFVISSYSGRYQYNHSNTKSESASTYDEETSGWYARLDHECPERTQQIETWLGSWLEATKKGLPIAATLPNNWPTLPAGLLSNPGTVLDHLIARFDAQSDGRSPRGVYAPPARLSMQYCTTSCAMEEVRRKNPRYTLLLLFHLASEVLQTD